MSAAPAGRSPWIARLAVLALALAIWFVPPPEGLTLPAWRLFAIFIAAIVSVIIGAFPILTASVFAAAGAVLTRPPHAGAVPTRDLRTRRSCSSCWPSWWRAPS